MNPKISTIIFDLGGVIISHRSDLMPYIIAKTFDVPSKKAIEIWHKHKDALLTGELPSHVFLEMIRNDVDTHEPIEKLQARWQELYIREAKEINTSLLDGIDTLRHRYTLYLFTDTLDVHHEFNEVRGLYTHFDHVFASHVEGKSKSQGRESFVHFLSTYNLQAESCVFVDDMQAYIDLARSLGVHGFLYTSLHQLQHDLKSVGVQW